MLNREAEAEIERLVLEIELEYDGGSTFLDQISAADALRAAMTWAFIYAARHCEAQVVVWGGQGVDPGHVLDMIAKNIRSMTESRLTETPK